MCVLLVLRQMFQYYSTDTTLRQSDAHLLVEHFGGKGEQWPPRGGSFLNFYYVFS